MTIDLAQLAAVNEIIQSELEIERATKEEKERAEREAAGLPEPSATHRTYTYIDTDEKWDAQALITEALGKIGQLGGRNNAGVWLACQIRDEGYSQSEAERIMGDYQASVPDPASYYLHEAISSVEQAYKKPPREKRKRRKSSHGYAYGFTGTGIYQPETIPADQISGIYTGYPQSDEGNAQCFYRAFPNRYLYCDAYGWMAYTGTHWESLNAEARLERDINLMLAGREQVIRESGDDPRGKVIGNAANVRGCKFHLQSMVTVAASDFDNEPDYLNCKNGVADLITGEINEHEPAQRFTYCIPVDYEPFHNFEYWHTWLSGAVLGGTPMADWLQQAVGYSVTGYTREEVLFYIYGPPRSGKGTFTETITTMLGNVLSKEVDFQTFAERRNGDSQNFDLAPLKPTRFVAASESGKYQQLNAPRIKAITGGNDIHCAFKHKDFFSYRPQFKVWLSSNHPINADVDDDAIWARARVIEFPISHVGSEDKTLKQRMKSEENQKAVLAWAVWGAVRWFMSEGGLTLPDTVRSSTRAARESADYVQQFIDDTMIVEPSAYITNADLYAEYKQWCIDNGITPKHKRALSMALSNKGFTVSQQVKIGDKNHRCVIGITSSAIPHYR